MLLPLENEQKIYRSKARLHVFLIQKMDFTSILRRLLLLLMIYLATATSILLLTGTIVIVNNKNTRQKDERNT